MPSLQQNMIEIRYLLDEPSAGTPSDRILWSLLKNQAYHHQTQLQNADPGWSVANWPLVTAAGVEDYLVTATDFGKPFWIHTDDPTNLQLPRVEIPFASLNNTDMFYQGPVQPYVSSSDLFSAVVISFYRTGESWYARLTPIPGGSVQYLVWYETAPGGTLNLGDSPGLSPFQHLIRMQTAIAALPYCGWGDVRVDASDKMKAQAWMNKTKALAMAFTSQQAQFQREFDTYKASLAMGGVERRQPYGEDYLYNTSLNWGGLMGPNQFGI